MITNLISVFIMFINTIVRLLPITFYSGAMMSFIVFEDFRAQLLFIGFVINELLAFAYKNAFKGVDNMNCALLTDRSNYFVLPSSITQTVGFFFGFILLHTYYINDFETVGFIGLIVLLVLTIFSRINVGCETLITSTIFALIGTALGAIYYYLIKDYYVPKLEDLKTDETYFD